MNFKFSSENFFFECEFALITTTYDTYYHYLFSNIHIFTFLDRLLNHHREFPRTALKYTVVESKTCSWNDFSCTPLRKIFINFVLSMLMSAGVLTTEAIQNDVVLLFTAGFARFLLALMVLQNIVTMS